MQAGSWGGDCGWSGLAGGKVMAGWRVEVTVREMLALSLVGA